MWDEINDHDYEWPTNYHLLLNPTEQSLFLRPHFNPMEWEPQEIFDPIGDLQL